MSIIKKQVLFSSMWLAFCITLGSSFFLYWKLEILLFAIILQFFVLWLCCYPWVAARDRSDKKDTQ